MSRLRQQFGADFASSAFRRVDGDERIVGRFGDVTQLADGTYDAWFHGPDLRPLSGRKLAALEKKIKKKWGFVRLTGEGYSQSADPAFVREVAVYLRVRRRRRPRSLTPEERRRLAERMALARAARSQHARSKRAQPE